MIMTMTTTATITTTTITTAATTTKITVIIIIIIRHSFNLLSSLYISVPHPSQFQSTLLNL
jgi:hypothetical protein